MKKNGIDYDECCYEEMSKGIGGQSIESDYYNPPFRNQYELNKWNSKGYDQSGMKK